MKKAGENDLEIRVREKRIKRWKGRVRRIQFKGRGK
jgi:hypothetical protein